MLIRFFFSTRPFASITIVAILLPTAKFLSAKNASALGRMVGIVYLLVAAGLSAEVAEALASGGTVEFLSSSPMQGLAYLSLALNQVIGSVGFLLLAKEESDRELQKAANTDNLPGILKRRTFREPAKASVAHCARKGESIALAIMDLDYFKRINDKYGHLAGDESVGITVSAGILARTATESLNLDELFRLADEALYRAKAEGRNRVVAAE